MKHHPLSRVLLVALFTLAGLAAESAAQQIPIPNAESPLTQSERAAYRVSRADLGRVYLALERAAADHADAPVELLRSVNERFDRATDYFFVGDFSTASRIIVSQVHRLSGEANAAIEEGGALRCTIEPRVLVPGPHPTVRVSLSRLYPPRDAKDVALKLRVVNAGGDVLSEVDAKRPAGADPVAQDELVLSSTPPGRARVEAGFGGRWWQIGSFMIVPESLDTVRDRSLKTLSSVKPASDAPALLARAARIAAWRAEQLNDSPQTDSSASIVVDFAELAKQVEREAQAISRGENPYAHASGDWWMPFELGGAPSPMRLIVPAQGADHPRPLIIAVHGAGGDEHLFPVGYGAGEIKSLAEKRGFLVASPRAGVLTGTPATFDAIVDAVAESHDVDRSQIYVLGHSLGGAAVSAWAKARPDAIAAAVSIAGVGLFSGAKSLPPTLAIAGELDSLARPDRIERDAKNAAAAGLPVEYREIANYGHALVVAKCLPEAVDWLLAHPRSKNP